MKTLPLALILTLSLTSAALAETIVDGVVYPEITELGRPRSVSARPQLGSYSRPQSPVYTARSTTAPADVAPALTVTSGNGPTVQSVPAYNLMVIRVCRPVVYGLFPSRRRQAHSTCGPNALATTRASRYCCCTAVRP